MEGLLNETPTRDTSHPTRSHGEIKCWPVVSCDSIVSAAICIYYKSYRMQCCAPYTHTHTNTYVHTYTLAHTDAHKRVHAPKSAHAHKHTLGCQTEVCQINAHLSYVLICICVSCICLSQSVQKLL